MGTEASTGARTNLEESSAAPASPGEGEMGPVQYVALGGGAVMPVSVMDLVGYSDEESDAGTATGEEEHRPDVA